MTDGAKSTPSSPLHMNDDSPRVLKYESLPANYGVVGDGRPFEYKNDTVRIYESLTKKTIPSAPPEVGEYRVHIEVPVASMADYSAATSETYEIIEQIEKLWTYVCGEPLRPLLMHMSMDTTPDGWRSNEESVHRVMNIRMTGGIYCKVEIVQTHWVILPYFPLERVLIARQLIDSFEDVYVSLIDLHHDALTARSPGGRLFALAKGLELVTRLMHGKTHRERQEKLDPKLRAELRRSINELHDISNNRFNVRHVVANPSGPKLHPPATRKELSDFKHDCELLLRYHICKKLGFPRPQFINARSPAMDKT